MSLIRCSVKTLLACAVMFSAAFSQTMQVGESHLGVSNDPQLKWIGNGIPGKIIDMEFVFSQAMISNNSNFDGKFDYKNTTARLGLYFRPKDIVDCKLSMPFLLKQGPEGKTGPFGDLSADISRSWGTTNKVIAGITIGVPIGYSSISQDTNEVDFLPPQIQPGSGLFCGTLRTSYAVVPEWGIINVGASYQAGIFAIRTYEYGFTADTVKKLSKILLDSKRFEFARDGWGARNDAGVTRPDYLGVFADCGIKTETVNHGISIGYFYPTAPNKYEKYSKVITPVRFEEIFFHSSNQVENASYIFLGQQSWDNNWVYLKKTTSSKPAFPCLTLQYSIEKNDLTFPIFLGTIMKFDYDNRLNLSGFSVGLGFKFPVI
jgi:hypothetical protein